MSFERGKAVASLPIGSFINASTGAVIITGSPTGKICVDGTGDDVAGSVTYDADSGQWILDALSAAEMDGDIIGLHFELATALPINLTIVTDSAVEIRGSVDDESATAGGFIAAAGLSAGDDVYNRLWLVFVSGALQGISRQIDDYVGSTRTLSFGDAFPASPADGDRFVIIGHGP